MLYAILQKHPHLQPQISVLLRTPEKVATIKAAYPEIRAVIGDLNDYDLLRSETAMCDICVHCASIEDLPSTKAISQGLTERRRKGPAFWIATSGADSLGWKTIEANSYGDQRTEIYNDDEGIHKVLSLPLEAPHRDVEQAQLASASETVRVTIVNPPCIYGQGRGPGNQRSIQLPDLVKFTLENGAALQINKGQSRWANVHVEDLSNLFLSLFDDALKGSSEAIWGQHGYYFAENGVHAWGQIAQAVANLAKKKGYIKEPRVQKLSAADADNKIPFASLFYGTDCVCQALKARRILDWKPQKHCIEEEIELTMERERSC